MKSRCDCGLVFGGVYAFDMHRVGTYEVTDRKGKVIKPSTRRCLSTSEMEAKGMVKDKDVWRSGKTTHFKTPLVKTTGAA